MDAPVLLGISLDWPDPSPALRVREVHRRTGNLEDPRGRRFSLVTDPRDLGPRTVWLDRLPDLQEGDVLPPLPSGREEGFLFDPRIRPGGPRAIWRPLWREWLPEGFDPDLAFLAEAWDDGGPEALVGLGPGHTPAGDDVLAGWLVGLGWIGSPGSLEARRVFGLRFDPERTSWLAGDVILDALEGLAWARPEALMAALEGEERDPVLRAAAALTGWGHTSGRAWMGGFARALEGFADKTP